jgi:hypothetical protein
MLPPDAASCCYAASGAAARSPQSRSPPRSSPRSCAGSRPVPGSIPRSHRTVAAGLGPARSPAPRSLCHTALTTRTNTTGRSKSVATLDGRTSITAAANDCSRSGRSGTTRNGRATSAASARSARTTQVLSFSERLREIPPRCLVTVRVAGVGAAGSCSNALSVISTSPSLVLGDQCPGGNHHSSFWMKMARRERKDPCSANRDTDPSGGQSGVKISANGPWITSRCSCCPSILPHRRSPPHRAVRASCDDGHGHVFEQSTACGSFLLMSGSHAHSTASASRGEPVRIRRVLLAVAGGAVAVLITASPALAAGTWQVDSSPNPAGSTFSQLNATFAASRTQAWAVGQTRVATSGDGFETADAWAGGSCAGDRCWRASETSWRSRISSSPESVAPSAAPWPGTATGRPARPGSRRSASYARPGTATAGSAGHRRSAGAGDARPG